MYHHSRRRIITGAKQPRNDATRVKMFPRTSRRRGGTSPEMQYN